MPNSLSPEGTRLLNHLTQLIPRVDPNVLDSYPNYKGIHDALGLQIVGKTWGLSLDLQGMSSLGKWTSENNLPAITGLIIDREEKRPGGNFFRSMGKDRDADLGWWQDEVKRVTQVDWTSFTPYGIPLKALEDDAPIELSSTLKSARTVSDISDSKSRFFLKSEWGPVSPAWPALSFSKRAVGDELRRVYDPNRDFIVYAGTSNPDRTKVEEFRKRLLSVLIAEPAELLLTESLVPWENWKRQQDEHGKVWPFSFSVRAGWDCVDLPWATEIAPEAYRALGFRSNWGGVVEVLGSERAALLNLALRWVDLPNRKIVEATSQKQDRLRAIKTTPDLNRTLTRMESLISLRLGSSRLVERKVSTRTLPVGTNLIMLLDKKLYDQGRMCALCDRPIPLDPAPKLLQSSPDRIDSTNPSYGVDNLQITHLGCNLAKNDGTTADFQHWLRLVSTEEPDLD